MLVQTTLGDHCPELPRSSGKVCPICGTPHLPPGYSHHRHHPGSETVYVRDANSPGLHWLVCSKTPEDGTRRHMVYDGLTLKEAPERQRERMAAREAARES